MPRFDWRDREDFRRSDERDTGRDLSSRDDFGQADYSSDYAYDPARRTGVRAEENGRRDDYGQADYSNDYAYDRNEGRGYRRFSEDDRDYGQRMDNGDYGRSRDYDRDGEGRSWGERAGSFFGWRGGDRPREDERTARRRRGPSDRVLWTVIVERLEDERRLDLRDVDVHVENGEVTLSGTVRRKEDKRRIEDIADIDGVRHVQNNLRVRDRGPWAII